MILNLSMAISSPVKKPIFNPNPKYPTIKYKDPKYPTIKYKDPKYPTTSSHFFTILVHSQGDRGGRRFPPSHQKSAAEGFLFLQAAGAGHRGGGTAAGRPFFLSIKIYIYITLYIYDYIYI